MTLKAYDSNIFAEAISYIAPQCKWPAPVAVGLLYVLSSVGSGFIWYVFGRLIRQSRPHQPLL